MGSLCPRSHSVVPITMLRTRTRPGRTRGRELSAARLWRRVFSDCARCVLGVYGVLGCLSFREGSVCSVFMSSDGSRNGSFVDWNCGGCTPFMCSRLVRGSRLETPSRGNLVVTPATGAAEQLPRRAILGLRRVSGDTRGSRGSHSGPDLCPHSLRLEPPNVQRRSGPARPTCVPRFRAFR